MNPAIIFVNLVFVYDGCLLMIHFVISRLDVAIIDKHLIFVINFHLCVAVSFVSVPFKFLVLSCYQIRESLWGITSHAHHFSKHCTICRIPGHTSWHGTGILQKKGGRQTEGRLSSPHSLLPPPLLSIDPPSLPPPPLLLRSLSWYFRHLRVSRVYEGIESRSIIFLY